MNFMNKHFRWTSLTLLTLLLIGVCSYFGRPEPDLKPHFMLNNTVFWLSSRPNERIPDTYTKQQCITVEVDGLVAENGQANGLPVGTTVFLSSEEPYIAYVGSKSYATRYVTEDAGRSYIQHNENLYVSVYSCDPTDETYSTYPSRILVNELHDNIVYLGETKFEGWDRFPTQELGSNTSACEQVYQDLLNPNVLYLFSGTEAILYVLCI